MIACDVLRNKKQWLSLKLTSTQTSNEFVWVRTTTSVQICLDMSTGLFSHLTTRHNHCLTSKACTSFVTTLLTCFMVAKGGIFPRYDVDTLQSKTPEILMYSCTTAVCITRTRTGIQILIAQTLGDSDVSMVYIQLISTRTVITIFGSMTCHDRKWSEKGGQRMTRQAPSNVLTMSIALFACPLWFFLIIT